MGNLSKLPPATEGNPQNTQRKPTKKAPGKLDRMLSLFSKGYRLNTFQARDHGDSCLHTTVSTLQSRHGIKFSRDWQSLSGRFGPVRVRRYWLEGKSLEKAQRHVKGPIGATA